MKTLTTIGLITFAALVSIATGAAPAWSDVQNSAMATSDIAQPPAGDSATPEEARAADEAQVGEVKKEAPADPAAGSASSNDAVTVQPSPEAGPTSNNPNSTTNDPAH